MRALFAGSLLALVACTPPSTSTTGTSIASASASGAPSSSGAAPIIAIDVNAATIRDTTLQTSKALETVTSLVDEVGPRLTGSPGFQAAVVWATRTLTAYGLTNVHTEPVTAPAWQRGEERAQIVAPYPHDLSCTALGGSPSTPAGGVEAEVVMAASIEALDKLDPATVKGKILFLDTPMERTRDGEGYGKAVVSRALGPERGAKLGALAVVIRTIGTDTARFPHTGAIHTDAPVVPAAALAVPDADILHRLVEKGPVKLKLAIGSKKIADVEQVNVIGDVKGAVTPDEIVLVGAHLDSWDLGEGAIDDGAGVAIVSEVGRQIAAFAKKPRRTVRVVLFANEEMGTAGAKAYAKAHEAEANKHVAAMEADLGGGPVWRARFRGPKSGEPIFDRAAALLARLHVESTPGEAEAGADVSPLLALGVPIADLRQDASKYFDNHHSANDTLALIDRHEIDQAAAAFTAMAYALADDPGDLGRVPEDLRKQRY